MTTVRDRDHGARRLLQIVARRPRVRVGIFSPEAGAPKKSSPGTSLVVVAAAHEFGIGVPRRSFINDWAEYAWANAARRMRRVVKRTIQGGSLREGLEVWGSWAANSMKYRISLGIPPELSERRKREKKVRGKKGDRPLIDTGQLRSSITYQVEVD